MKNALKIVVPLIIAIGLIWGIFLFVDYKKLIENIGMANPLHIVLAIIVSILSHLARAYRWKLFLQPLGHNPSLKNLFIAVMTAYFGNIFIPRGGEVMRCAVLTRSNKVPFSTGFATVVAERVFDFICLLVLIGFAFLVEHKRFLEFFESIISKPNSGEENSSSVKFILLGVMLFGTVIFFAFKNVFLKVPIVKKIYDFIFSLFVQAFDSFRLLKKKNEFIIYTLLIWVGYFASTYIIFFSLPFTSHLDLMAGLVILIVGGLGMSAPASGGIGPFHIMVAGALTLFYNLSKDDGVAYAFVLHTSQLIAIFFIGGICALWSLYLKPNENAEIEN